MKNRNTLYLLAGIAGVFIAIVLFWLLNAGSTSTTEETPVAGIEGDPTDIVLDFYKDWVELREATSSDAFSSELIESDIISPTLRTRLKDAQANFTATGFDPILCATTIPENKRSRTVFENETAAQVVVYDKDAEVKVQRSFTLSGQNGIWQITNIECSANEQALQLGEFSFDKEGYLLRESLPESYDKQYWYLVFEQANTPGYTAPLLLNDTSVCILTDGSNVPCADDLLREAQKVRVQGTMSERGPEVVRIEIQ